MDDNKDGQKDIQKTNPLSRFFDKHSVRTNPFGGNRSAERAYRRTERIVAALYLVTNHIAPTEPLRVAVRAGSLQLLEDIISLRDEMRGVDSVGLVASRASLRHLISLVRILAVAGLLSVQNTNTMTEALDELGAFLVSSQNSPLSESVSLTSEDLMDIGEARKDVRDRRIVKDNVHVRDRVGVSDRNAGREILDVREQNILGFLHGKGELGIRDIAANLPEYSEKMIQRDLADLVAAGLVKKAGLKRWSRYSIVL
jgi:hypothetical protein